jgi:RNA polymerase primary sigma factor
MRKKFINFDEKESLTKYFKEIKKSIILSQEEELTLAKKIKLGDTEATNRLINANLKFVVSIAKEYQNQGLPLPDLISEGNYGLIKAASKFDHTRGFRFISYAVWWIKQSIIQSLNDNARVIRLPSNIINKLSMLKKEIEKFEFENEREPVYGEILDENNEPIDIINYKNSLSLNDKINEEGDEIIDILAADPTNQNDDENDRIIQKKMDKILSILDERERNIIESYYGINTDYEAMTLEAIGEKYDLTKERIRQIKEKAIRKLRHNAHDLLNLVKG